MKTLTRPAAATHDALPAGRAQKQADQRPATVAQRQVMAAIENSPRQTAQRQQTAAALPPPRPNRTGLPDALKAGVESFSGHSLDDVQVHYNSAQPAQLQAHAYAQGTAIHLAPGQEKHLPHEAWHVAQQKQGRVRPTMQLKGVGVNDNDGLEREADLMGRRAARHTPVVTQRQQATQLHAHAPSAGISLGTRPVSQLPAEASRPRRSARSAASRPPGPGVAQRARGENKKLGKHNAARSKRHRAAPGTHGFKKHEQVRLKHRHKIAVTGDTHESEHAIGFEPINRSSGLRRGSGGRARKLENSAPAYQEVKALHRDHIGTGSRGTVDASGFNAESYRRDQRNLLESGQAGNAFQINQLAYAFNPVFQQTSQQPAGQAATDSYNQMVENTSSVTFARNGEDVAVPISPQSKGEAYLARLMATHKRYPTDEERAEARVRFRIDNDL